MMQKAYSYNLSVMMCEAAKVYNYVETLLEIQGLQMDNSIPYTLQLLK